MNTQEKINHFEKILSLLCQDFGVELYGGQAEWEGFLMADVTIKGERASYRLELKNTIRPVTIEEARIIRASINNSVARALMRSEYWYSLWLRYKGIKRPWNKALFCKAYAVVIFDRELV